jgi:hypothetical protein
MRLLHREPDVERADDRVGRSDRDMDRDGVPDDVEHRERHGVFGRRAWNRDRDHDGVRDDVERGDLDRDERTVIEPVRRERVHRPFHVGNLLAIVAGAALAVIGIVALVRTDLNESWDQPFTTVLDIDHTPLLAVLEVGAGALLVLMGLTGRRFLALLAAVGLAVAAAVAAIEPGRLATQYALEEWWAWTVAGSAAFLALVLMLPSRRRDVPITERERKLVREERVTA